MKIEFSTLFTTILSIVLPILISIVSWATINVVDLRTTHAVITAKVAVLEQHDAEHIKNISILYAKHAEIVGETKRVDDKLIALQALFLEKFDALIKKIADLDKKLDGVNLGKK